jgi:hypothetical protein
LFLIFLDKNIDQKAKNRYVQIFSAGARMLGANAKSVRKELIMPSKSKEARLNQKEYLKFKLDQRLAALAERSVEPHRIVRDTAVRMIRAQIRETDDRLKAIVAIEKKTEEMAKVKAEKLSAPKEEKTKKRKEAEEQAQMSKRKQKKKEKKKPQEQG